MCIYGIVKIGINSYNKVLHTYKVAQYSSLYHLSMQRLENLKTSVVYCSAPTHTYLHDTLPLDNLKIHLHLALLYITTEHSIDCQRQAFKLSELFIRSEGNQTTFPLYGN